MAYEPIHADNAIIISTEESRVFLRNIGIDGEIVATTSHSADSISLILDSGECFVGDLEPIEYLDAYEQNDRLKYDWELVMHYAPEKFTMPTQMKNTVIGKFSNTNVEQPFC